LPNRRHGPPGERRRFQRSLVKGRPCGGQPGDEMIRAQPSCFRAVIDLIQLRREINMKSNSYNRRDFLRHAVRCGMTAAALPLLANQAGADLPKGEPHKLTVIAGKPRERGKLYGKQFKYGFRTLVSGTEESLRYAAACGKAIRAYAPEIM